MRKSTFGLCLALPVAALAFACSSSDDSSTDNGGTGGISGIGGVGGTSHGGESSGGTSSAGHAGTSTGGSAGHAGTSTGGAENGGSETGGTAGGGTPGAAGAGQAGSGEAGEGGTGNIETPPANAVYTLSNDATANAVFGFSRGADGSLTPLAASFPTLGAGSGAALGSQGSLSFDKQGERLYAVNAGDNSFSVFPVNLDGSLGTAVNVSTTSVASGTLIGPKSITYSGNTVYVLFEGSSTVASKIAGWTVTGSGAALTVTPIGGSALPLSQPTKGVDPAEIAFSPDGNWLVVTEKQSGVNGSFAGSGMIDTFAVGSTGLATNAQFFMTAPLPGMSTLQSTPYGFDFQGSNLVVSEAGSNGVGVYTYVAGVVAPSVAATQFLLSGPAATQVAPCWVAVTGSSAYVANAHGPNISGFTIGAGGLLGEVLPAVDGSVVASTGTAVAGPTDETISADGKFLYVLNAGVPSLGIFAIESTSFLTRVGAGDYEPTSAKLPVGSTGLVAR